MPATPVSQSGAFTQLYEKLPILEAATTSRVIVNNDVLRHVLFSMDAGQVLTEHASPRAVIVNMLQGRMSFTVAGVEHILNDGDVVYLAPGERHALEAIAPCYMSLTLVKMDEDASERN